MVKRDISEHISKDTVRSVQGKNSLNWTLVQRKEILAKNDLKLGLTFVPKVFRKQGLNLWEEDVRFYLDGASVTQKWTILIKIELQELLPGENVDQDFISL